MRKRERQLQMELRVAESTIMALSAAYADADNRLVASAFALSQANTDRDSYAFRMKAKAIEAEAWKEERNNALRLLTVAEVEITELREDRDAAVKAYGYAVKERDAERASRRGSYSLTPKGEAAVAEND